MAKPCPICGKPAAPEHKPFCCERCKNVDLNRWFTGRYAVPTEEKPADTDSSEKDE